MAGSADTFRAELVKALAVVYGPGGAEQKVEGFEALIRARAEEGATKAVKRGLWIAAGITAVPIFLELLLARRKRKKG